VLAQLCHYVHHAWCTLSCLIVVRAGQLYALVTTLDCYAHALKKLSGCTVHLSALVPRTRERTHHGKPCSCRLGRKGNTDVDGTPLMSVMLQRHGTGTTRNSSNRRREFRTGEACHRPRRIRHWSRPCQCHLGNTGISPPSEGAVLGPERTKMRRLTTLQMLCLAVLLLAACVSPLADEVVSANLRTKPAIDSHLSTLLVYVCLAVHSQLFSPRCLRNVIGVWASAGY
jgi:hypothetical protein